MFFRFTKKSNLSECFKRYFNKIEADALLSANTIAKYKEVSGRLVKLLGDIKIGSLNGKFIQGLKTELNEMGLSPTRKNHYLVVIKNLLQYLTEEEKLKVYDHKLIVKFKVPQKEITYISKDELLMLANAPKKTNITGLRMRAAISSDISTSLRVSELLNIKIKDINFETGILNVRTKGNKPHRVILNQASRKAIKEYLAKRNDDCEFLFATTTPNPKKWQVGDFERSLRNLGKKLGFRINITPHLIGRRSVATFMYKEGVPLGIIQAQLNHSSSQVTTKFYIGNLAFEDVLKHHNRVMNFELTEPNNSVDNKIKS